MPVTKSRDSGRNNLDHSGAHHLLQAVVPEIKIAGKGLYAEPYS
jgi:hypothetical protein